MRLRLLPDEMVRIVASDDNENHHDATERSISALAFITIGGVLALSIFHFGHHLKDPENMAAAKTVAKDLDSAATAVSSEGVNGRSLRQRLDEAPKLNQRLSHRPVSNGRFGICCSKPNGPIFGPPSSR